jgi:hypothetical protein
MNIYHVTYGRETKIIQLHFWGCNLDCRANVSFLTGSESLKYGVVRFF